MSSASASERKVVPDSVTAQRIAEAVIDARFGEEVRKKYKPYKVVENDKNWLVEGTSSDSSTRGGGMPTVVISKADGKIVKLYLSR